MATSALLSGSLCPSLSQQQQGADPGSPFNMLGVQSAPQAKQLAAARPQSLAANQAVQMQHAGAASAPASATRPARRPLARRVTCSAASEAPTKVVETGLPRTAVVGVLGGGQLGKMLGQEAVSAGGRAGGRALHSIPCWPHATLPATCMYSSQCSRRATGCPPTSAPPLPLHLRSPPARAAAVLRSRSPPRARARRAPHPRPRWG